MKEQISTARRTYRVDELAAMLGISRAAAYNLVRDGYIQSIRAGRMILIPVEALEEFLASASKDR